MSLRFLSLFAFFFLSFTGCAEEKHAPPESEYTLNSSMSSSREGILDCSLTFSSSHLCLNFKWEKKPTEEATGSFIFKTFLQNKLDQTPVQYDLGGLPQVILWMPAMGHGSSPTTVERIDVGTYRVTGVYFVMPGEWQIRFQVREGEVVRDESVLTLSI